MVPDNLATKDSRNFDVFKDEFPEELVKWLMYFHEIESLMTLKEPVYKTRMIKNLLKVPDLSYFDLHLRRRLEGEDIELPDKDLIELLLRDICLK
jgi:hypothetical protein